MIKGNKKKWTVGEELSGTFDQPKLLFVTVGYNGLFHPHFSEDEQDSRAKTRGLVDQSNTTFCQQIIETH